MIVHNTPATNTPNHAIAIARAEIEANRLDAQEYFKLACYYVERAHCYPANSIGSNYQLSEAKRVHSCGLGAIIRVRNWQDKLDAALAAQASK